jgi:hypothetical protein
VGRGFDWGSVSIGFVSRGLMGMLPGWTKKGSHHPVSTISALFPPLTNVDQGLRREQ